MKHPCASYGVKKLRVGVRACMCASVKALWMVPEVHSSNIAAAHSPLRTSVGGNQHWYASLDFNLIIENCLHAQNERGRRRTRERDITIGSVCLSDSQTLGFNHGHSARPEKSLCPELGALLQLKQCGTHTFSLKSCDHFPIASTGQKIPVYFLHKHALKNREMWVPQQEHGSIILR